jgi:hypothetical protein
MFNVVRKSNNSVVKSFNTESDAREYLANVGPQRNFMTIIDVSNVAPSVEYPYDHIEDMQAEIEHHLLYTLENARNNPGVLTDKAKGLIRDLNKVLSGARERKAGTSELSQNILTCLKDGGMSCASIANEIGSTTKKVSDRCWLMERQGLLIKVSKGVYACKA